MHPFELSKVTPFPEITVDVLVEVDEVELDDAGIVVVVVQDEGHEFVPHCPATQE